MFLVSNFKRLHLSNDFKRVDTLPVPIIADEEKGHEVEVVMRYNSKGANCLVPVM